MFLNSNAVVTGVSNGETYDLAKGNISITLRQGTATLNGIALTDYCVVNKTGEYTLIADTGVTVTPIQFTVIDTTPPKVYGVADGGIYTNAQGSLTVTFDRGTAILNGSPFENGGQITGTGDYSLSVADTPYGGSTSISFSYVKYGDLSGDGSVDIVDLILLKRHLINVTPVTGIYNKAALLTGNEEISITDLLTLKSILLSVNAD